jgi:type I restriction enzyme S subunit
MKQYDLYKDSGVDWIGKFPTHWKNSSLKWYSEIYSGGTPSKNVDEYWIDGTIPWLNSGCVNQFDITEVSAYITEDAYINSSAKWIPDKSLVMALAGQGKTKGMVGQVQFKTTCNQSLGVIVPSNKIDNRYLMYWLRNNYQNIRNLGGGDKRDGLNLAMLGGIPIPIPSVVEQTQIANYLDHKTTQIDNLISKKEKLIELLKEERIAIINQAVTKGLNPNAPMKDSGIEWLGEIPEHWECKRIGHISKVIRGASPRPAGDPLLFNGDFLPWITVKEVTNAHGKFIVSTESYLTELGAQHTRILDPETLILSNSGATLGVPRITLIKGGINDGSVAFLNLDVERDFLYYFFVTHTNIYREEAAGYGQPNLNTEIVKSTKIPIPPKREQIDIVLFIENQINSFNKVLELSKREIELLKEYKITLISEVVTGKVDVRDEKY